GVLGVRQIRNIICAAPCIVTLKRFEGKVSSLNLLCPVDSLDSTYGHRPRCGSCAWPNQLQSVGSVSFDGERSLLLPHQSEDGPGPEATSGDCYPDARSSGGYVLLHSGDQRSGIW